MDRHYKSAKLLSHNAKPPYPRISCFSQLLYIWVLQTRWDGHSTTAHPTLSQIVSSSFKLKQYVWLEWNFFASTENTIIIIWHQYIDCWGETDQSKLGVLHEFLVSRIYHIGQQLCSITIKYNAPLLTCTHICRLSHSAKRHRVPTVTLDCYRSNNATASNSHNSCILILLMQHKISHATHVKPT